MRKRTIYFVVMTLIGINTKLYSQENIATKLGYPADSKLLIIHADDLGAAYSTNIASIEAIENGSVNSASVMMPTAWVVGAVNYAKANPDTHDLGIHLTLSSDSESCKWGPVASKDKVPSLINEYGYFHDGCKSDLNIDEVEIELKAQIDRAYSMGFEPTHLDLHQGCLFRSKELGEVYLKMGQLYNLPVMIPKQVLIGVPELKGKYNVSGAVDYFYNLMPETYAKGTENYYTNVLKNLKSGLSYFSIHTAYGNEEMKGMCGDNVDWGYEWRQKDFDFFTSDTCKQILKEQNIILITYRQLKEKLY